MNRMTRRVIPLAVALGVLPACQFCDDTNAFSPTAALEPAVIDLGPITTGVTCPAVMSLVNNGNADLTVEPGSAKLIDTDGTFTLISVPALVTLGSRGDVQINYTAGETIGSRESTGVEIGTNDPSNLIVRGSVTAFVAEAPVGLARATCLERGAAVGAAEVACETLDFGAVGISSALDPIADRNGVILNVTIVNDGNKDLTLQGAVVNGSGDFIVQSVQRGSLVVVPSFPVVIAAGRSGDCGEQTGADNTATISVKYSPTAIGAGVATLQILTDGAEGSAIDVALSGQGSDTNLLTNPEIVVFGSVPEGSSASEDVLVQNVGTAAASVNESCIDLEDDGVCDGLCTGAANDTALDGTLRCTVFDSAGAQVGKGFVLGATDAAAGGDDERTITLEWNPTAAKPSIPSTAVLMLKSNIRNNKVFKVGLSGGNVGSLEIDSTTPCGSDECIQADGDLATTTSWTGSTTLTLRNSGTGTLTLGTIAPEAGTSPAIADDFTIGAPATTSLAPGASTTLTIEYANNDASQVDGFNLIVQHNGVLGRTLASIRIVPPAAE